MERSVRIPHVNLGRGARVAGILALLSGISLAIAAEATQTPQDSHTPPTEQILTSYQGQTVTSVDIAGRPDLSSSQFASAFSQQADQPFDQQRVQETASALKAACKCEDVRI